MTFVFDENIPHGVVAALRGGDQPARHVTELLDRGTKDEPLFTYLGERKWYLVTADLTIARNPQQRSALVGAGIGAFFFTGRAKRDPFQWVQLVIMRWKPILDYASKHEPPFLCAVPDRGELHRMKG